MNVNPFSYLIEKLKSKVSKSGDTMSGGLKVTAGGLEVCGRVYNSGDDEGIVVKPAPNNLAGLILGSNNGKRSVFYCRTAAATAPEWNYVDGNNNSSAIYHPAKSGTIALTSDLATVSDGSYTASSSYPLDGSATIKVNNKVVTFNAVLATLTADASGAFVQVGTVSPSPVANTYFPVFNGQDTTSLGYGYIASTGKVYMHKNYLKSGKMPVAMATYIAQ